MAVERLLQERDAYREQRPKLLKEYRGKWVAVFNGRVIVHGDEFGEVVRRAFEATGGGVFYVTKVGEEGRVERRVYRNG